MLFYSDDAVDTAIGVLRQDDVLDLYSSGNITNVTGTEDVFVKWVNKFLEEKETVNRVFLISVSNGVIASQTPTTDGERGVWVSEQFTKWSGATVTKISGTVAFIITSHGELRKIHTYNGLGDQFRIHTLSSRFMDPLGDIEPPVSRILFEMLADKCNFTDKLREDVAGKPCIIPTAKTSRIPPAKLQTLSSMSKKIMEEKHGLSPM